MAGIQETQGGRVPFPKFEIVSRRGNFMMARCPAHEDRQASLSIRVVRNELLLFCHAGCRTEDILVAMGLGWSDLFNVDAAAAFDSQPSLKSADGRTESALRILPLGREIAVYPYHDEDGKKLFEVVRFEGKAFRQRKPDGSWGLKGVRRVLYRLPEVLAAVAQRRTVWLVEGEKDADAIRGLRQPATTAPMGAGKWLPEYTGALRGGIVNIVADRDFPGRASARAQFIALREVASVQVFESVSGKDVSDHLAAGFTLTQLRARYRV